MAASNKSPFTPLDPMAAEPFYRQIYNRFRSAIDSYSAFFENDHETPTGLAGYLRERGLGDLTLCGLATDFCVAYSALDAAAQGFVVTVRLDACRGIDLDGSLDTMLERMREAGVTLA